MKAFKNKKNVYTEDYEYMDEYGKYSQYDDDYNSNYNDDYDDNGYEDYGYNNDYIDEQENDFDNYDNKKENRKQNGFVSKSRKKAKKKHIEDYSYSTGYDDENIYYNDNGEEVLVQNEFNFKTMLSLVLAGIYFCFLLLGFFGTTFANGYKPQIITSKIRGERITYNKVLNEIDFLEEIDNFDGLEELQEVYKTGNFQSRIPPLKKSLKEVTNKIEDMKSSSYKVKENDYINVEMIDMTKDLLESEKTTLTMAIRFYESMSGYSSTSTTLEKAQNDLLNQQQVYKNKLANYKLRLEQIKSYDLKIED